MYGLKVIRFFSAAHQLRGYKGKCEELHGHNYKVEVCVKARQLNDIGLAVDFKELKKKVDAILERLDHHMLNDVPPFDHINPSAENLAGYIYKELSSLLPKEVLLEKVIVWESRDSAAVYFE